MTITKKDNFTFNSFVKYLRDYRDSVVENPIVNEEKTRYRTRDDHTKKKHCISAFDYYLANKNKKMLVAFKEIYGIANDEMADIVDYYERGQHQNYHSASSYKGKKHTDFSENLKSLYEDVDYDRRKSFEFVADLVSSVKQYRTTAKRFSILDERYNEKSDLTKKWARISLEVASEWWREKHQRTDVRLGVFGQDDLSKDKYGSDGRQGKRVIKDENPCIQGDGYVVQPHVKKKEYDYYKDNAIEVPSLWYLNVYRHGLSTVIYKSRPCMVIKANPKPIQRLKDKGFDVYKADIVSSKNGEISLIQDLFLISYQAKKWARHPEGKQNFDNPERTFAPHRFDTLGECHTACNESLSIAERTMSGRVVSGIANALDI
ncbi:MAG: hypothetical protein CMD62_05970 [Gammaproteobacteria bacterium]|nr:hypothetical protein [Gammaproteobacteria bacterium]|tara:strand:- start:1957 stop:3081 length:1125 start_codon:yes stop_codon:yes gene_type:complete